MLDSYLLAFRNLDFGDIGPDFGESAADGVHGLERVPHGKRVVLAFVGDLLVTGRPPKASV